MKFLTTLIIIAAIVLAWCPWFKPEEALGVVETKILELQATVPHLCAMQVHRDTISKVPFGYTEKVSYDCTKVDALFGVEQSYNIVFITFYKEILGMPGKTVYSSTLNTN